MAGRIVPVILAGGSGTRLWPISRDAYPKQFQPLTGPFSTYQLTLKRVADPTLFERPLVVTSDAFRFFAQRQAADVGVDPIILLEPSPRDSAGAVAAAAAFLDAREPGRMALALASDHVVLDDDLFRDAVRAGIAAAEERIVVFGLRPNEPKTSYGYIRPGAPVRDDPLVREVVAFVEKPDLQTAMRHIAEGYLWNVGNFLFRTDVMIGELASHAPDILQAAALSVERVSEDMGFQRLDPESFRTVRQSSIDYAVIERTRRIAVVECHFRWSDVGSWDALWQVSPKDGSGNAVRGDGLAPGSSGCLIHADGVLTTVIGAEDLVVVASKDAVMVVPKARAQAVKGLIDALKANKRAEATLHRRDYRPWGYVEAIDAGIRFEVKRIVVDPGGALSLQTHQHRAEHWVIVRGTATVQLGDEAERVVSEDESLYVPIGLPHRLSNRGRIPLEMIEIRTGAYIGEDDVTRLDDLYNRS
jgi:mannose-1-phosphate guanylyltransferase/mannose-1-phosphate guanylyltransferase/mannose-6-phosphate isomerase